MAIFQKKPNERGTTMTVEQIMTRDVVCCSPDDSLSRAAQLMWERDCGCIPVVQDQRVVGMITDRDCCMAAYTKGLPLHQVGVREVMAKDVKCASPREAIATVEDRMARYQIRRMPVVDDGGLVVGLLSLNDVALAVERGGGRAGFPSESEVADTLASISQHRGRPQPLAAE